MDSGDLKARLGIESGKFTDDILRVPGFPGRELGGGAKRDSAPFSGEHPRTVIHRVTEISRGLYRRRCGLYRRAFCLVQAESIACTSYPVDFTAYTIRL